MVAKWRRAFEARRRGKRSGEAGNSVIEFVFLGVLVTVPIFYLIVLLARLHAGAYAVSLASREAGRTFVTASSSASAPARAQAAAAIAFEDQGFVGQGSVGITCAASPCLTRDAQVRTNAVLAVEIPFVPDFVSGVVPDTITLSATHVESVDRYGDTP